MIMHDYITPQQRLQLDKRPFIPAPLSQRIAQRAIEGKRQILLNEKIKYYNKKYGLTIPLIER